MDEYTFRLATVDDADAFSPLLASLGYPCDTVVLRERISRISGHSDEMILVATRAAGEDSVVGLLSIHFIPQLGLEGDVARIGFLVVDERVHNLGIGKMLESRAEELARERGCNRMV